MADHLQRSSTTGHLIKTASGHLSKKCQPDCPCPSEIDCGYCTEGMTPDAWTVTFADVDVQTDCQTCTLVGSSKVTGGTAVTGGVFSGTWLLTQDSVEPCLWVYDGTTEVEVSWYGTSDCTGTSFDSTWFKVTLEKIDSETYALYVYVGDGSGHTATIFGAFLPVFEGECCNEEYANNGLTAYACDDVGAGDALGKDGTGTITPCEAT